MINELLDLEICLYIHEYIFIYDIYKSNNKNYEMTLNDITLIIDDNNNKESFHEILLEIIEIDNYKDEMLIDINNKNNVKISLDSDIYLKTLIKYYKKYINKSISYNIINNIIRKSLIILIKSGNNYKHLIKFSETQMSSSDLKRITENDYNDDNCLICLENINNFKSFRIFNCCFSKTCCNCFKANDNKCPICNIKNDTLISY